MDQKSFHGLDQGINEDLSLIQVTINDSTSSCCPITTTASDYDPSIPQTSFQPQAFNISQLPGSTYQPLARSRPSTIPRPSIDSTYSCSLITQDGDLTTTAFEYAPILFQTCSQPEAFNISQFALSSLQPLARSWSFTDNPTMSNGNINYPFSPSELIPSPTKRPSISTATTGTSSPSKPTSTHTAHSNVLPSHSENRITRRRAQNCAAQRAFRARKEDTIKESSMRFEILKAKFERLEGDNGSLNNTVDGLRGEIDGLRRDHGALR